MSWCETRRPSFALNNFHPLSAMLYILVLLQLLLSTSAFPMFRSRIPNGNKVPHPSGTGIWDGVGHWRECGGGDRNPFGKAFKHNGYKWTSTLCQADSDGDGKTNGVELGDPDCTWKAGDTPKLPPSSHPGICEPTDSDSCRAKNAPGKGAKCPPKPGRCNGANTANTDIRRMNLRFDRTVIPATETNYYCQMFDLDVPDKNRDYHISADRPFVDDKNIVHHMLLYACPDNVDVSDMEKRFGSKPAPCGMMVQEKCSQIIGGWAAGGSGSCFDGLEAATRIGKTGFKKAVLEVHYNNPLKLTGRTDTSGIDLFYDINLRLYDLAVLTVGQNGIIVPPKTTEWAEAQCTPRCIGEKLRANGKSHLNIVSVGLHMHLAGKSGYGDLIHKNHQVESLIAVDKFDYNAPEDVNHYPPLRLGPDDTIRLQCQFDTTGRDTYTYYGPATSDEMCYTYITYYPAIQDFTLCLQYGNTHHCNGSRSLSKVRNCDVTPNGSKNNMILLEKKCDLSGQTCKCECADLVFGKGNPCFEFDSDGRKYMEYSLYSDPDGAKYIRAIRSCDAMKDDNDCVWDSDPYYYYY